jgi:Holliday junction resolvase RusA-like endonuclease
MIVPGLQLAYIVVYGHPAPQGSKRLGINRKTGRAVVLDDCDRTKSWRNAVHVSSMVATHCKRPKHDGPLIGSIVFTMPRAKSLRKADVNFSYPSMKPDVDKLLRCTCDALTTSGVIADDARIVKFTNLAKVYPGSDDEDALSQPGAVIKLWRPAHFDV